MKNIFITSIIAVTLLSSSCSEWTKPESLNMSRPTLEEQDPVAYQNYLASLREYKKSEHKVVIVTIRGTSEAPSLQNQHLTSMADSVDIICMSNVADLHPTLVKEIPKVHTKGMSVVCVVDYISIEEAWKEAQPEGTDWDSSEAAGRFTVYCKEQTELQLSYCDKYGFDGIEISYTGRTQTEVETSGQTEFIQCVEKWRTTHPDKMMFFRGYARNLIDRTILEDCAYIVILGGANSSSGSLTVAVQAQLTTDVPKDRTILEVAIPSILDPVQVGATPQGAAAWVNEPSARFTKSGMAIVNAHDDYFNIAVIYKNIKQATAIMNPASNN